MRIAIDIDSTLHHYWPLLSDAAKRRFGIELPYDRQFTWAISRLREEQLRVCVQDTHSDEAIANAEPYPHAVETVNRWHRALPPGDEAVARPDRPRLRRALLLLRQGRALPRDRHRRPHRRQPGQHPGRARRRHRRGHDQPPVER
jgi:hypothetical protein